MCENISQKYQTKLEMSTSLMQCPRLSVTSDASDVEVSNCNV